MLDVSEVFDIKEIKITDTANNFRQNSNDDVSVTINWIALFDREGNFKGQETFLYITLYAVTDEKLIPLERKYVSFGPASGWFFEIEKNMTMPRNLIKDQNIRAYRIELSFTDKCENEISLEESLKTGTFFKTTLPLLFLPEEL